MITLQVISILQMYRLNSIYQYLLLILSLFQYFKCIGWISLFSKSFANSFNFNTSNVSVEYEYYAKAKAQEEDFNTSNVSVELLLDFQITKYSPISILQMYRLNYYWISKLPNTLQFQYFKCIGWIGNWQLIQGQYNLFQYFKCIGWIFVKIVTK